MATRRERGQPYMKMRNRPRGPETVKDPLTGEEKPKTVTAFTPTAEELTQGEPELQSAAAYSKGQQARQAAVRAAKEHRQPLGAAPPIPEGKLDGIAAAARASREHERMPKPSFQAVAEPPQVSKKFAPPAQPPGPPPIQGVGSGYAINQALASGEVDRPISLKEAKEAGLMTTQKTVSPESEQLLAAQHAAVQETEDGQVAIQNPELPTKQELLEDSEKDIAEANQTDPELPLFDYASYNRARSELEDDERRKMVEDRLPPLNFSDLITKKEIQQEVIVIPGEFSLGYRTVKESEHLFCMKYLYEKTGGASTAYVEELFGVFKIVCSVISINGAMLPDHRKEVGKPGEEVDRELFEKKLNILLDFPTQILADMGVQHTWFHQRVNRLFSVERLKNG